MEIDILKQNWRRRRSRVNSRIYDLLLKTMTCGPFDGGCHAVASAIQKNIGGRLCSLIDCNDNAQHIVVESRSLLWDHDGPEFPEEKIINYNKIEFANITGFRPIKEKDITNRIPTCPSSKTENELIELYKKVLSKIQGAKK